MLQALRWAPLVGVLIGFLQALLVILLVVVEVPALVAGLVAVGFAAWLTRGLHEDGLADYVDGLGGGWTPERRLAIMKDSHIGAFGTIALMISIGLRASAIASIASLGAWSIVLALVLSGALSRLAFLLLFKAMKPARSQGLSHAIGSPNRLDLLIAAVLAFCPLVFFQPIAALAVVAVWIIVMVWLLRQARVALGGHTGDVAGALQQCGETVILIVLSLGIWR